MKLTIPNCLALSIGERRWFVLRVKGGTVDPVFDELRAAGYDVYAPRRRYDRHLRRQRVMAEWSEPLMATYIFIVHPRLGQVVDDWTEVRAAKGVMGPLGTLNGPIIMPERIIEAIAQGEFASMYDDTAAGRRSRGESERERLNRKFVKGRRVVVNDGPFATFPVEVDSITQDERVRALVDILGRLTLVEFAPSQLDETEPKRKARA